MILVLMTALQGCTFAGMVAGAASPTYRDVTPAAYAACEARHELDRDCTDRTTYPELRSSRGAEIAKGAVLGLGIDATLLLIAGSAMSNVRF